MTISKQESLALRALAIIGIFMHNYCHFMPWAVKENEYTFNPANPANLMLKLQSPNSDLLVHLFSFFGHYGVPVFLFLSGYGLVMKYERKTAERISFGTFAKYNYLKLLRLMLPAFVLFVALWIWRHGEAGLNFYSPAKIIGHITMTINLWEHPSSVIKPGPYWYFGLTMQLYLLFHIAFYRRSTRRLLVAVAVCLALQLLCIAFQPLKPANASFLNWYRYNFMGSLLPFAMGMLLARYGEKIELPKGILRRNGSHHNHLTAELVTYAGIALFSFIMVFLMSFNVVAWTFAPFFVCTGMVALVKAMPFLCCRPVVFIGGISAAIFAIHPHLRELIIPISKAGDTYTGLLYYIAATILAAFFYSKFTTNRNLFNRQHPV